MERNVIWLILFALFVIEGAVLPHLMPTIGGVQTHLDMVLVSVLLIGLLYHRHSALLYGICFGLMHDLMYGQMIGVFSFAMGFTGYMINLLFADKYQSMLRDLLMLVVGCLFFDLLVSLFYYFFDLYHLQFSWHFLWSEILLSVGLNIFFAGALYLPAKKHFQKMAVRYGAYSA